MSNSSRHNTPATINHVFAKLQPEDVEQFYMSYRQWLQQRRLVELHTQIATLRQQIVENNQLLQQTHPTPIALATLARLQSNGVTDLDLLDRMLERGEAWLDNTMQQLEYCEQFDFIRDGYSTWCEHALEGAYDWIDSMHKVQTSQTANRAPSLEAAGPTSSITPTHPQADETLDEATEEVFLQKLMNEEDVSLINTVLEIAVVSPTPQEETLLSLVDQDTAQMQATGPNAVLQTAQSLAKHTIEHHTPDELSTSRDAQQIASIKAEDTTTDNFSFEDTIPTKAILLPTRQDQEATSAQPNETNAAPSVTTTTPAEHDEMDITGPVLADTTNTSSTSIPSEPESGLTANQPDHAQTEHPLTPIDKADTIETSATPPLPLEQIDTIETSITPHLPFEQVEPVEPGEAEYKYPGIPAPAEETHPTHANTSDNTPLSENAKATTAPVETSPDEVSIPSNTPVLEDAPSSLTPATAPPKEISDYLDSPTVPEILLSELPPTSDVEPTAEQLNATNDTPWHWDRPLLAETENTSLTTSSNPSADQESTQPTSPSTSSEHSPYTETPKKRNILQILFRIFFSRKPKNTNAK